MSPVLSSTDSDYSGTSNISTQIESLQKKLNPIIGKPVSSNQNANKETKLARPGSTTASSSSSTRKAPVDLLFASAPPAVVHTSERTRAKYEEVVQNSGLFHIDGEYIFIVIQEGITFQL
ncbi:unnamed protein product [Rotaria magnacalcarata]|uniref:Uncharacterized protein n=1 Tax=Rotaria magnacalcarata TaxID=392030 RepID=A0A819V234_9BILA|nr:unnamed protein product [Rotaria magnacalcarata]CAF5064687.1 unnamed protein product [Rotaria magnacalcarata]